GVGRRVFALSFGKTARRRGKPLIFGRIGGTPLLGLPGNPVSTLVCAHLFLRPAIQKMLGEAAASPLRTARLLGKLPANEHRQDYVRARCTWRDGQLWAAPFPAQDSS